MYIIKWKKPKLKMLYTLWHSTSNSITFWKRENYGDSKISVVPRGWDGRINRWSSEDFKAVKILCMILQGWIHVSITRREPHVNYRVIMTCQCKFTDGNKCTLWWGDVDRGGGYAHVGQGVRGKPLYILLSYVVNLKPCKKNKIFKTFKW